MIRALAGYTAVAATCILPACRSFSRDASTGSNGWGGTAIPEGVVGDAGTAGEGGAGATGGTGATGGVGATSGTGGAGATGGSGATGGAGTGGLAGGEPEQNGDAGEASNGAGGANPQREAEEEVFKPGCVSSEPNSPLGTSSPTDLAANLVPNNVPYALYVTQTARNDTILRWKNTYEEDASWQPWSCFDSVPRPDRIAALNIRGPLTSRPSEVYVTTAIGQLYVRRTYLLTWAAWTQHTLPLQSKHLQDVATASATEKTPETLPYLFVLDGGQVFSRHHLTSDAYSNYSPWSTVSERVDGARRICAAVQPDGGRRVFVLTASGVVLRTTSLSALPNSSFGAYDELPPLGSGTPIDIDCGYTSDGSPGVFVLTTDSVFWTRGDSTSDQEWARLATPTPQTVMAIGSSPPSSPTIFTMDEQKKLSWRALGTSSWNRVD